MMKTIYEVDEENHHGGPDPPVPLLLYVPSNNESSYYIRSLKHPVPILNPHNTHINAAKFNPGPDIFYPAWRPLPGGFRLSVPVRPLGVLVKLTQDGSLINVACPNLTLPDLPGAARKKALDSTEILEQVFSHIDEVTLLTSVQRVSKDWKEVVDGSVFLQRKLFFLPDETRPLEPHPQARREKGSGSGNVYPVLNSLLVRHFRSSFFPVGGKFYGYTRRSESFYEQRWTSKHNKLKLKRKLDTGYNKYESVRPDITKAEALQIALDRDRFTRAGASWRKMLVSQPPIQDFIAMEFSPNDNDGSKSQQKLKFYILDAHHPDKGLRMGQLYDFVQDKVGNHPLDSLWYRVVWFEPRAPFASDLSEDGCGIMFDEMGTKCVVEMFHREDEAKRFSPTLPSSFPSSIAARAGPLSSSIAVREGPLSSSRSYPSASRSRHNPPSSKAFDAIFKCAEYRPVDCKPAQEVLDYGSVTHRKLIQLED
ncbi:hypothetical protein TGAMA5MH_10842 [Trichoderma gamsii]|uniref:F-box domain-containing protein n=1 Tax=Trichoderma gamsii TaxID=398673 RepID=A0A2K0SVG6_9HYPO|nr:hypothetical protein TGAMA5MH_10842 [Trichoderma gamsii]